MGIGIEQKIDEAIDESFPASDPPAWVPAHAGAHAAIHRPDIANGAAVALALLGGGALLLLGAVSAWSRYR